MAWQSEALTVLLKDLGWIPGTPQRPIAVCNSISRGSDALFWPPWALYIYGTQICVQAGRHSYT